MHAKARQLYLTLCNTMDCTCPGPLSMGFSRQEYWNGLQYPAPGDLPSRVPWWNPPSRDQTYGVSCVFLSTATLVGLKWYLITDLTCISLMINAIEYLFIFSFCFLLATCTSYLEKFLFTSFAHF